MAAESRGLLIVYTGAGKGKTTATLKAVYAGDTVYFLIQYADPTDSIRRGLGTRLSNGARMVLCSKESKESKDSIESIPSILSILSLPSPLYRTVAPKPLSCPAKSGNDSFRISA